MLFNALKADYEKSRIPRILSRYTPAPGPGEDRIWHTGCMYLIVSR